MEELLPKVPTTPKTIDLIGKGEILPIHAEQINMVKSSYEAIRIVVKDLLVSGIDYGKVKGIEKPMLFQPGAEKIAKLCNFGVEQVCTNRIFRDDLILYEYKCIITQGENKWETEGGCNCKEEKYRYKSKPLSKKESTDLELLKSLRVAGVLTTKTFGGDTVYYKREERADYYDIANTIMKMAQKRAFVGAVLKATGLSEKFSQDMEDFIDKEEDKKE